MKGDSWKLGIWLAGSGVTLAALYLISSASSGHKTPVFPYWIFLGLFLAGGCIYLWSALQVRLTEKAPEVEGEPLRSDEDVQAEKPMAHHLGPVDMTLTDRDNISDANMPRLLGIPEPVVTDRWRFTLNGFEVPVLAHIGQDGFGHPAYSRPVESTPPLVRVKALVACSQLEETPSWQDLRGRFLGLLGHERTMTLISELTVIRDGAIWRPRATSRRAWLEADLTGVDDKEVPVASAKLLLPAAGAQLMGTDRRYAELSLHVDLVQSGEGLESEPALQGPPYWRRQFARALVLPGDLEGFLRHDLGLVTSNDPPAQFGVHLEAQGRLTGIVSPGNIRALPAPYIVSEYSGYAIAEAGGKITEEMAGVIMLDLSERVLHLDGAQEEMSGLAEPDQAAPREIPQ